MSDRQKMSGTLLALGIVLAAAGGAVGATLLLTGEAPETLRSASALTEVAAQPQGFTDDRTVEVSLAVTDPTPLTATTSGVVTALHAGPGTEVVSGTAALEVAGVPVLALHTRVPLYRALSTGTRGDDVRSLQDELIRLGYDVTPDGRYGRGTSAAVRHLKSSVGFSRPDGSLALEDIVWLPAPSVRPSEWEATLGSTVESGDAYGVAPGQLTAVSLASAPASLVDGARTLTLWGHTTDLDDQLRATSQDFLDAVTATDDYAAVQASEEAQHPVADLALVQPLETVKVPPTALFAIDGDGACLQSGDSAVPVTIVGSALGASLVTVDDGSEAPTTVRIGPGISATGCR